MNAKYWVKKKGVNLLIEKLKQRLIAKTWTKDMNKGFHNLGKTNYFKSYRNRCTKNWMEKNKVTELSWILKIFWSDIWSDIRSIRNEHNQHAVWLKECRKQLENVNSEETVEICHKMVKIQCRKMPN